MAVQAKKIPLRKCTGCQEMKSKKEMMRILRTSEGDIILDTTGRKTGAALMSAVQWSVLKRQSKIKGWSAR